MFKKLFFLCTLVSMLLLGSACGAGQPNPDVAAFWKLAGLTGTHTVSLSADAELVISEDHIYVRNLKGDSPGSVCDGSSDLGDMAMVTALSTEGVLSLAWCENVVQLYVADSKVQAEICKYSCTQDDFKPTEFE